jgi:hypothetical protein
MSSWLVGGVFPAAMATRTIAYPGGAGYPAWPYSQILAFEAGVAVATEPTPHRDLVPGTSAIGPMLPEVSPIRLHWPVAE